MHCYKTGFSELVRSSYFVNCCKSGRRKICKENALHCTCIFIQIVGIYWPARPSGCRVPDGLNRLKRFSEIRRRQRPNAPFTFCSDVENSEHPKSISVLGSNIIKFKSTFFYRMREWASFVLSIDILTGGSLCLTLLIITDATISINQRSRVQFHELPFLLH